MVWCFKKKRGELDYKRRLVEFADKLEKASIKTIEDGTMTKDLALLIEHKDVKVVNTECFIKAVRANLDKAI